MSFAVATSALPPDSFCASHDTPACQALRDVYSRYNDLDKTQEDSIFAQIGRAVSDFITSLAKSMGGGWLGLVGGLLLLALVVFVVWRILGLSGGRITSSLAGPSTEPMTDSPDEEWKIAERAAAAGDFREAIRRAFRSALLDVAHRGRLRVDASWTTRELLTAARGDARLVTALAPASASFDEAWYSGRPVDRAAWDTAKARCAAVRELARSRDAVEVVAQ